MIRLGLNTLILLFFFVFCAASRAGDVYWIDVRTAEEFNKEHVTQAFNIPYEEVPDRIGEVSEDPDALIYLYCRSGRRADIAKEALEEMGYSRVVNLRTLEKAQEVAAEAENR